MASDIYLSVIVPLYNEEESVGPLHASLKNVCDDLRVKYEIIFLDDGSSDDTYHKLSELHDRYPEVRAIKFRKNYGQTAAMAAGFEHAQGEIIISMDGDLQNDPIDIPRLVDKLEEGYDLVCGWRKDRKDKLISRRIPSLVANWLIGKITGVPIHDNGCSLKAYRAEVIKKVSLYSELHRFIPAMSTLAGARITEMVVTHHARKFGKSKYGISRVWRVFLDLFLIKMFARFSVHPMILFGLLSLPVFVLGLICFLVLISSGLSGIVLPSVVFLSFFLVGHFVTMGVLGEMVLKTGDYRPEIMLAKTTIRENDTHK